MNRVKTEQWEDHVESVQGLNQVHWLNQVKAEQWEHWITKALKHVLQNTLFLMVNFLTGKKRIRKQTKRRIFDLLEMRSSEGGEMSVSSHDQSSQLFSSLQIWKVSNKEINSLQTQESN